VLPALRATAARHDARILIVGAGPSVGAAHDVEVVPWSEETEVDCIRAMDIGIMPLDETPWARGKCGYKLIQYMACGLPVVASPVGVNVDLLAGGTTGLAGADPAQFAEAVGRLLADADLRARMGLAGRRLVEAHYSLSAQEGRFVSALQAACQPV
jgi:glycosyltransferase involved in cell wall biosynthesis